jgi:hypothetical protein
MEHEIEEILEKRKINGGEFWNRKDGDIHAPAGFSTIDVLNTLGDLGVDYKSNNIIEDALGFVFSYYDKKGCFKYSPRSSKLPCITARILTGFKRLKYIHDNRMEQCYKYFLETQQEDGGWRCATVKMGKSSETDASNPGTTLYVLDAFRFRNNSCEDIQKLNNAVMFLLNHWISRKPLGPCKFGIGSRFLSIEFPFLRYNIFYYVYILSKYDFAKKDVRFITALKVLKGKCKNNDLYVESPHKAWSNYSFAKKGCKSEVATLKFKEIVKDVYGS